MLTLLLKLKSLIPCGAILITILSATCGFYWRTQCKQAQATITQQIKENATCKASNDLLQSGVERWKAAANQYDRELKRKETIVAKNNVASKKRLDAILQAHYSSDCNQAIQQGLQQLS
jgi:multidrug resistance efflux pump